MSGWKSENTDTWTLRSGQTPAAAARTGVLVVRSWRGGTGFTDRNAEINDDKMGFAASLDLDPQKARIQLQLQISNEVTEIEKVQPKIVRR